MTLNLRPVSRRTLLAGALALTASGCAGGDGGPTVRIGHQKNGVLLLAKKSGRLDEALAAPPAAQTSWLEFSSGPPLLEALGVGSIDIGSSGDAPPIFAQASGSPLVYVAAVPLSGRAGGLITPGKSSVQTVADLKGKKLCFTRGSSAHNLAAEFLDGAGLGFSDVEQINLAPSDAAAAFAQGGMDGWVIWDPYFTAAIKDQGARVVPPAAPIAPSSAFIFARRAFAESEPDLLRRALDALADEGEWAGTHRGEVAQLFAEETGLPLPLLQDIVQRDDFLLSPLTDAIVTRQQAIANRFAALGLIPQPISIADAVWQGWSGA